ncbi:Rho termination factor N-terminal domain-containing protein, partial [Propionibacterium acidifaciens]|uniref:Rho termination factor N-terminal domain-containing protein n=1 Tax=Propionibacterium acidifaciens TaxID=556499 RepID=UPI0023F3CE10
MTESQAALAIAGEGSTTAALSAMRLPELKAVAAKLGIKGAGSMRKSALVEAINAQRPDTGAERGDAGSAAEGHGAEGRTGQQAPRRRRGGEGQRPDR